MGARTEHGGQVGRARGWSIDVGGTMLGAVRCGKLTKACGEAGRNIEILTGCHKENIRIG